MFLNNNETADRVARQTPSFRAGKDSADAESVPMLKSRHAPDSRRLSNEILQSNSERTRRKDN